MSKFLYYRLGSFVISLIFITGIIALTNASPIRVFASIWDGAFGTVDQFARVIATLAPLLLCAAGLIYTFTAGLYNLGIEGQVMFGAIAATFVMRLTQNSLPPTLVITLSILGGAGGGAFWGLCTGFLNVYGKVSEIFAGLGLNFVAQGLALYLVFGPWKRPGVASMSGTDLFDQSLWLPTFGNTEASPIALAISAIAVVVTIVVVRGTYFGLQLRAVGKNLYAAHVLGIPAIVKLLSAFAICGGLGGLAGALQVVAVFHRLIPNASSNLGFLALLVVMLVAYDALWITPVAFFFSALNIGSLQLPLVLQLESSLAGVIQGTLILFALLGQGFSQQASENSLPVSK